MPVGAARLPEAVNLEHNTGNLRRRFKSDPLEFFAIDIQKGFPLLVADESEDRRNTGPHFFIFEERHPITRTELDGIHEAFGPIPGDDVAVLVLPEHGVQFAVPAAK